MDVHHPKPTAGPTSRNRPRGRGTARLATLALFLTGAALLLSSCLLPGQGTLQGQVVDTDGAGVNGLTVTIYAYNTETALATTTTAPDGSFAITRAAGFYRMSVTDPNSTYLETWYRDASSWDLATTVQLDGGLVTEIDPTVVTVATAATITGTVENTGAAPLAGITANLMASTDSAPIATATTDIAGDYSFGELVPGSYKVGFTDATGTYGDQFGGGALAFADATTITVAAGASATADATLDLAGSISGTVSNGTVPLPGIVAFLWSPNDVDAIIATDIADANGFVRFDHLGAGTYYLGYGDPLSLTNPAGAYRSAFYDTTSLDFATATPIVVGAGQDVTGRDLALIGGGCDPSIMFPSANLAGADLSDRNLSGCNLYNANLAGADASGSTFAKADIRYANFDGADLTGASLAGSTFQPNQGSLWTATLTGADVSGLSLFQGRTVSPQDYTGTDFSGSIISSNNFTGSTFTGSDLTGADANSSTFTSTIGLKSATGIADASFSSANLSGVDLSNLDLTGIYLYSANLTGAEASGTTFVGADLRYTNFDLADLTDAVLAGATIVPNNGNLWTATLTGADVSGLSLFQNRDASGQDYTGTDFTGATLSGNNFSGATFSGADVTGTNFDSSTFTGTIGLKTAVGLADATLSSANLSGIDLSGVDLTGIYVYFANLSTVDFTGSVLDGADLRYANLAGADMTDASLLGASWIGNNLTGTIWSNTTCTDGTNSTTNGGTCAGH